MNFIIKPYIGIGNLLFNTPVTQVEQELHNYNVSISKVEFDGITTCKHYYEDLDLIVGSNQRLYVEYFEFFGDAVDVKLMLNDTNLLKISYSELLANFAVWDKDFVEEIDMLISYSYGVGVGKPENNLDFPESIIVFKKDYYS